MMMLKKVFFLVVMFCFVLTDITAQKVRKKTQTKTKTAEEIEYDKYHTLDTPTETQAIDTIGLKRIYSREDKKKGKAVTNNKKYSSKEYAQEIPKEVQDIGLPIPSKEQPHEPTQEEKVRAMNEKSEDILQFFISEAKNIKHLSFVADVTGKSSKVSIDSLPLKYKELLDSFLDLRSSTKLSFGDYTPTGHTKIIQTKIAEEYEKPYKERSKAVLHEINDFAKGLPPSIVKVDMELQYAVLTIGIETFNEDYNAALKKAETTTALIADPFERSRGYLYIADFAKWLKDYTKAMEMYYLAWLWVKQSFISRELKSTEEGKICQNIGYLLYMHKNSVDAIEMAVNYLDVADNNFRNSKDTIKIVDNWIKQFADNSYLLGRFYWNDTGAYAVNLLNRTLNNLNFWYHYFQKGSYSSLANSLGFYSLGLLFEKEQKYSSSLVFFLEALKYAISEKNEYAIGSAIYNVAHAYFLLNDTAKYIEYTNLRLYFAKNTNKYWDYNLTLLEIADDFYDRKKYDSALLYVNRVQFDTALQHILYPTYYEDLVIGVLNRKYYILDSLKSDSARIYEQKYFDAQEVLNTRHDDLIDEESIGKDNLMSLEVQNQINLRIKETDSLKFEKSLLEKLNSSLTFQVTESNKTIVNLQLKENSLSKANKILTSSIATKTAELVKAMDSANYYGSLSKNNKVTADNLKQKAEKLQHAVDELETKSENLKQQNESVKWRSDAGWASLAIALGFLFSTIIVSKNLKKRNQVLALHIKEQESEALRLQKENEENNYRLKLEAEQSKYKLLSSIASNHDVDKFIPMLPDLIENTKPGEYEKLLSAARSFRQYNNLTKQVRNSLTNTITKEIEIAKKSAAVTVYLARRDITVDISTNFYRNHEIENLSIPKHMLTSLVANSVKHGSVGRNSISVNINAAHIPNGYRVEVVDDGTGFTSLGLEEKEENGGIKLLLSQIKTFNEVDETSLIEFSPADIKNKTGGGVIASFNILKR